MKKILTLLLGIIIYTTAKCQDLHFSQFFNSPMLLNPSNTALLQTADWRAGLQYRNQWATVPVPYNTFGASAEFDMFRNSWDNAWLGSGVSVWRDVAGNGHLALTRVQGSLASHIITGEKSTVSAGLAITYNQRSVDFNKLTYDVQWDEFSFNKNVSNQETFSSMKTSYIGVNAGVNYTYFNNDNFYVKVSMAASQLNQPVESFYGMSNKRGIRPIANVDIIYKANDKIIFSPSVYYTRQKKASELVCGTLMNINAGGDVMSLKSNEIILGVFYRNKDAIIGMAGYQWNQNRIMVSYDHTVSQMAVANRGMGALEISLIIQGVYRKGEELSKVLGCPRF